jgi:hypothetical protein
MHVGNPPLWRPGQFVAEAGTLAVGGMDYGSSASPLPQDRAALPHIEDGWYTICSNLSSKVITAGSETPVGRPLHLSASPTASLESVRLRLRQARSPLRHAPIGSYSPQ